MVLPPSHRGDHPCHFFLSQRWGRFPQALRAVCSWVGGTQSPDPHGRIGCHRSKYVSFVSIECGLICSRCTLPPKGIKSMNVSHHPGLSIHLLVSVHPFAPCGSNRHDIRSAKEDCRTAPDQHGDAVHHFHELTLHVPFSYLTRHSFLATSSQ